MNALLTGITGNLGYEVSLDLTRRGITVIPCIRPGKGGVLASHPSTFGEVVEADLTDEREIACSREIDCIVHCAGVVHFRDARDKNERMMHTVLTLAQTLAVPVYFVSTAFVYRPAGAGAGFNNSYEKDKFHAEQALVTSGLPYSIFRPSVLTGHSRTGALRHFTGFYQIARACVSAVESAKTKGRVLRFPRMFGESNMLPVDQAAASIGKAVHASRLGVMYVTNPAPPRSAWVLEETLRFFNLSDYVAVLDLSFQDFGGLALTEEEDALYQLSQHFSPYWSMDYSLPPSLCERNLVDHEYMVTTLACFQDAAHPHEQRAY